MHYLVSIHLSNKQLFSSRLFSKLNSKIIKHLLYLRSLSGDPPLEFMGTPFTSSYYGLTYPLVIFFPVELVAEGWCY
jgi:hypothetical protein